MSTTTDTSRGILTYEDPANLIIGANVRLDARLDKSFIASIKERGVLEPVVAHKNDDGQLVVLRGQRRTLAATQMNVAMIPVMVVDRPGDGDRLIDQVVENDHRESLTGDERIGAYQQMSLLGMSAGQIARRSAAKRGDVEAALVVAGNTAAREAAAKYERLTLPQSAVFAEFEGDRQAMAQLADAARWGNGFDHAVQRLRDARTSAEERKAAELAFVEAGGRLVAMPSHTDPKVQRLGDLFDANGAKLVEETHAACPGHAAYFGQDWASDKQVWAPRYVCDNWPAHGHTSRYSAESIASAAEKNEEQARADRRDVIASNKAWRSAETVRREWLRTFCSRPKPPVEAIAFVATAIAAGNHHLSDALASHTMGRELLGLPEAGSYGEPRSAPIRDLIARSAASRQQMILLVLILAAFEQATNTDSWRRLDHDTARYLRFIEGQGYQLSDVELRACGEPAGDAGGTL